MPETLSNFVERVNAAALKRKQKRLHESKLRLAIRERIRSGEKNNRELASWWAANGYLQDAGYQFKYRQTPTGFGRYRARCEAAERPHQRAPDYLYERLEKEAEGHLVNHAKSQSHFFAAIDQETGEYQSLTRGKSGEILVQNFDAKAYRFEQYALQSEARELLKTKVRNNGKTENHPIFRVCNCLRVSQNGEGVGIVSTKATDKVRFKGLQTCGSIWTCPVCAARISEHRAKEIRYMLDIWQAAGKGVIFVTNTIRHGYDDDLNLILDVLFGIVWNRYINHRAYKSLRKKLGYIGRVRAVEVTHGKNGWHPHIHEIWLIENKPTSSELNDIKRTLYKVWNATLIKAGLKPVTLARGVTVQPGSNAADYVAKFGRMPKWDMGKELTKTHLKHGKESQTPFDLLRASMNGDKNAGRLFLEYAQAFSGKRQLYFSTGLKDFFCLKEKTDDEIASSQDDAIDVLAVLTRSEWHQVLRYGNRATLLNIAENGGTEAIRFYIFNLQKLNM